MGTYRPNRNIEASFVDFLTTNLNNDWTGVSVECAYSNISGDNLPVVLIRTSDTEHEKHEIGSSLTKRYPLILIDVYATDDGQKLDLVDYLVSKLKAGISYYTYIIVNKQVETKTLAGRINITSPVRINHVDLDVPKDQLDIVDRYHSLISLDCSINVLE